VAYSIALSSSITWRSNLGCLRHWGIGFGFIERKTNWTIHRRAVSSIGVAKLTIE